LIVISGVIMSPILLLTAQFKRTLSFYLNGKTADCQTVPVRRVGGIFVDAGLPPSP
jgi:hypothetical protein